MDTSPALESASALAAAWREQIRHLRLEIVDLEQQHAVSAPSVVAVEDAPAQVSPRTEEVVAYVKNVFENKGTKGREKYFVKWRKFARDFPELLQDPQVILEYLSQFQGETGRHRKNWQVQLKLLYSSAASNPVFGLSTNPLDGLPSPIVRKKPIKTLSWEELRALDAVPETDRERAVVELLAGHGFRQIEVLRVTAGDVRAVRDGLIWCRGKERDEDTPVLPETVAVLELLAPGLEDNEPVMRARRRRGGRYPALGSQGMEDLVNYLYTRAGLSGYDPHDLRRTFATQVTERSGDELLGMRLIRDRVPGVALRYVLRDLPALLERYSPLRRVRGHDGQRDHLPVLVERGDDEKVLVETGEALPPTTPNQASHHPAPCTALLGRIHSGLGCLAS
jgi:integrase